MMSSELQLHLRGVSKRRHYLIATDERDRWLKYCQPEQEYSGFGEYRTVDHQHLFINGNHIVAARLLSDQMLEVPDNYDDAWKKREQPNSKTGEYLPETWRFRFWVHGCSTPFEVADVTISCSLLNFEHDGCAFFTIVDEDGEPLSLRIADVMLAEGFDCENYESKPAKKIKRVSSAKPHNN